MKKKVFKTMFMFAFLFTVIATLYYSGIINFSKWTKTNITVLEQAQEIANDEFRIPKIAKQISRYSVIGKLQKTHVFETKWFESDKDLFKILPYKTDGTRNVAYESLIPLDKKSLETSLKSLYGKETQFYELVETYVPIDKNVKFLRADRTYIVVIDKDKKAKLICVRVEKNFMKDYDTK